MKNYNYAVTAEWKVEPTSPTVLGERFLRTIETIAAAAPESGPWMIADGLERDLSIDEARRVITKLVEDNVARVADDDDEPAPEYGYRFLALNSNTISPRYLSWSASLGGKYGTGITFKAGDIMTPPDPEIVTYSLFRTALLATLAHWPSTWANACASRLHDDKAPSAPGIPPHPDSRYHIPWMSYLSAPFAQGLDVPGDILTERMADGGLLMIAAEERLDPTNPEHMRRSRLIAQIMIDRIPLPPWARPDPNFNPNLKPFPGFTPIE